MSLPAGLNERKPDGQNVVVLHIGALRLMLAQSDIGGVESSVDVNRDERSGKDVGSMRHAGRSWPVYCVCADLGLLGTVPAGRRACALLAIDDGYIGLLCDELQVVRGFTAASLELPASMRTPHSPVSGLVNFDEGLACLSDATRLATYLSQASMP